MCNVKIEMNKVFISWTLRLFHVEQTRKGYVMRKLNVSEVQKALEVVCVMRQNAEMVEHELEERGFTFSSDLPSYDLVISRLQSLNSVLRFIG